MKRDGKFRLDVDKMEGNGRGSDGPVGVLRSSRSRLGGWGHCIDRPISAAVARSFLVRWTHGLIKTDGAGGHAYDLKRAANG